MPDAHNRVTAVLEYSPTKQRCFVRAVLEHGKDLQPLEPGNLQNHVNLFFGVDHRFSVGISPLVMDPNHTPTPNEVELDKDLCLKCGKQVPQI